VLGWYKKCNASISAKTKTEKDVCWRKGIKSFSRCSAWVKIAQKLSIT
jgi:hypothetical protein